MESKSQHVPPGPDLCSDKGVQANQIDILSSQSGLERDSEKGSRAVVAEVEGEFEEYPSGIKLVLILVAGTLVQFVMMLDQSIISTAIPRITSDFDSLLDVGWYGSAYQLASASLQPLTGKIYSNFRPKWTFLTFFFIFELGSLTCAVATSSTMLIVARGIAGLGASGLMNGGLTIVSACLPKHRQPGMLGVMIAVGQLGQACGPLIGGVFTEYVSWRWCFYINLPIGGIVSLILMFLHIPDRIKSHLRPVLSTLVGSLDLLGFALFAPASIQFFLALEYGGSQYAWNSAVVIGLFCGAGVNFIIFLLWEYHKGDDAMIPFSMLRKRIVWSSCVTMFFFIGVLTCTSYYLPIYFQAVKATSPVMSGVYVLPNICFSITMAMVSSIFVQRLGYYLPSVLGGTSLAAVAFGLLSMLTPTYPTAARVGYQILAGFSCGCAGAMPYIAIQNLIPHAQISVAMAILIFCQNFGGATFLTIAQTIFSNSLKNAITKYAPGADVETVLQAGATSYRKVVTSDQVAGVLKAYSVSVDHVFYLICGACVGAFCFGWGMGWRDIRKKNDHPQSV